MFKNKMQNELVKSVLDHSKMQNEVTAEALQTIDRLVEINEKQTSIIKCLLKLLGEDGDIE